MDAGTHRQKRKDGVVCALDVAINALNLAKEASSITPAKALFGSASILLTMIRVRLLATHVGQLLYDLHRIQG